MNRCVLVAAIVAAVGCSRPGPNASRCVREVPVVGEQEEAYDAWLATHVVIESEAGLIRTAMREIWEPSYSGRPESLDNGDYLVTGRAKLRDGFGTEIDFEIRLRRDENLSVFSDLGLTPSVPTCVFALRALRGFSILHTHHT
jgi:hypothetical protein